MSTSPQLLRRKVNDLHQHKGLDMIHNGLKKLTVLSMTLCRHRGKSNVRMANVS